LIACPNCDLGRSTNTRDISAPKFSLYKEYNNQGIVAHYRIFMFQFYFLPLLISIFLYSIFSDGFSFHSDSAFIAMTLFAYISPLVLPNYIMTLRHYKKEFLVIFLKTHGLVFVLLTISFFLGTASDLIKELYGIAFFMIFVVINVSSFNIHHLYETELRFLTNR